MRGNIMLADVARGRDARKRLGNGGASRWPWRPPDRSIPAATAEDKRVVAAAKFPSSVKVETDANKSRDSERQQMSHLSGRREPQQSRAGDPRITVEMLWREFFFDPSKWWDHRYAKAHPRYPDFKHRTKKVALWLNGDFNPPWVEKELNLLAPGALQMPLFSWNAMLVRHMKSGQPDRTIDLYHQMERDGINPDRFSFVPVLNACASLRALQEGKRIHRRVVRNRCDSNVFVANSLIDMYSKCGSFEEAWNVFQNMPKRDVVSWNAMIKGCVKSGQGHRAIELFERMQKAQVDPDTITFVGVLNACAISRALEHGRHLHNQIIACGYESNVYVGTSLVDMYVECGRIEDARMVFDKMPERTVVSWNVVILGHVRSGEGLKALELYNQMQQGGVEPDSVTFVGMLKACASIRDLEEGSRVHQQINRRGLGADFYVGSSLVDMYSKCGSIDDAWKVFNEMRTRDVVSYNTMIFGHVQHGQGWKALELYEQLQLQGMVPDHVTFIGALNACASVRALEEGKRIHEHVIQEGFESDMFVGNSLVDMYAKCGSLGDAWEVFKRLPERDAVTWNAMILGLAKCGQGQEALNLYRQMREEGLVEPIPATFIGAAHACASLRALSEGHRIHDDIMQHGCETDLHVRSSLIDMYAKCGSLQDAQLVFRVMPSQDVVLWNAILQGCVRCGQAWEAFDLFLEMERERVHPVPSTFVAMLNACTAVGDLEEGKRIHAQVIRHGFESDVFVCSSLVGMYAKCGNIEDARKVFDEIPSRDLVCWNAMLFGYLSCERGKDAMELFQVLLRSGIQPEPATFVGMLKACASVEALGEGKRVHDLIIKSGCESHVAVSSSLIDMYAKCGDIEVASQVFQRMPSHDAISWNAIIVGQVRCGQSQKALELYRLMIEEEKLVPDSSLFLWILKACANVGALDEGRRVHDHIGKSRCKLDVGLQKGLLYMYVGCGSMVDARIVFNKMLSKDASSWNAISGGYAMHGHPKEALDYFKRMCLDGTRIDLATYDHLLSLCNQGRLLDEALEVFRSIKTVSHMDATVDHYLCMINLLGPAGRLIDAVDLIEMNPPGASSLTMLNALLDYCKTHGNSEVEELVSSKLLELSGS